MDLGGSPPVSPHGIVVQPHFYAHDPGLRDYAAAAKIKVVDVHPVYPWVVTVDEDASVVLWDYAAAAIVLSFPVDAIKDSQRQVVEALDVHSALAAANGASVPDVVGPGLGLGVGSSPGAAVGGGSEAFVSALAAGLKRRPLVSATLPEEVRSSKTGHVRSVKFADEHTCALYCQLPPTAAPGAGQPAPSEQLYGDVGACGVAAIDMPPSLDALASRLAGFDDEDAAGGSPDGLWSTGTAASQAPAHWIVIVCEHRVLLLDYVTRAVSDIPHSALLLEAGGPGGAARTVTGKGRPAVHSVTCIGPGVLLFGCEDGVLRSWSADVNAVTQTVRVAGLSGRPISHLLTVTTAATTPLVPAVSGSGAGTRGNGGVVDILVVAGCADGTVTTFHVLVSGGRVVVDNGGRGGSHSIKLGSDLLELTVNPLTLLATAVAADKTVATWDVTGRGGGSGGAQLSPARYIANRVSTSSAAAETGVGSRFLSAISLAAHPFFPPGAVLAASKGPHLELVLLGSQDKGAESGIVFYDLRAARPGLPSKLKVYTLAAHPLRPELCVVGTNVGLFVVSVAAHYSVGSCAAAVPLPVPVTGAAGQRGGGSTAASAKPGAIRSVLLHATPAGSLVASDVSVLPPSIAPLPFSAAAAAAATARGASIAAIATGAALVAADIRTSQRVLVQTLTPPSLPPPTVAVAAPGGGNVPVQQANAWAALSALLRGPAAAVPPGSRGVRLRVSGSGNYVAAVWTESKCHSLFRIRRPGPDVASWTCELVDSGPALDVAWSGWSGGAPAAFDDLYHSSAEADTTGEDTSGSKNGAFDGGATSEGERRSRHGFAVRRIVGVERYAVIEPGALVTGRGPVGGGMAIGSKPVPSSSAAAKGKASTATPPVVPVAPSFMSLRQLPLLDMEADSVKPQILIASVALAQEPVALFGGPVLAVCLASDTGGAAASLTAALAGGTLSFLGWQLQPPLQLSAEQAAKEAAMAARYSGLATSKAQAPRLLPVGSSSATPCPSLAAVSSGCGVLWDWTGTRLAVCLPVMVHISIATQDGTGASSMVEVCRVPVGIIAAAWHGSGLYASTSDGRTVLIVPPVIDRESTSLLAGHCAGHGSLRRQALLIDLAAVRLLPSMRSQSIGTSLMSALPPPALAPFCFGSFPGTVSGGHVVSLHWAPTPASPAASLFAINVRHPIIAAALSVSSAASCGGTAEYVGASAFAADCIARLPASTQLEASSLLASLGATAAALMVPCLPAQAGVALATWRSCADMLQASSSSGAPLISSMTGVDLHVGTQYLRRLLRALRPEDVQTGWAASCCSEDADSSVVVQVAGILSAHAAMTARTAQPEHDAAGRTAHELFDDGLTRDLHHALSVFAAAGRHSEVFSLSNLLPASGGLGGLGSVAEPLTRRTLAPPPSRTATGSGSPLVPLAEHGVQAGTVSAAGSVDPTALYNEIATGSGSHWHGYMHACLLSFQAHSLQVVAGGPLAATSAGRAAVEA